MAHVRSITSAAFIGCLMFLLPGFASAQGRVHEVRPSGDDYVVVGTEANASMDAVVALARRLTGNVEITSEDVLNNAPHARRYACRVDGSLVYFGTDPDYRGRCPDDGVRTDGVLRDTAYHVPREHGVVLAPRPALHAPRSTLRAASEGLSEASDAMLADAEARVMSERTRADRLSIELTAMTAARDEARANESAANAEMTAMQAELDHAVASLAARPPPTVVRVVDTTASAEIARLTAELSSVTAERDEALARVTGTVSLESRLHGRPIWSWFVILAMTMVGVFIFLLWPIRHGILKPHLAYRAQLEDGNKTLTTKVEGLEMESKTLQGDLDKEINRKVELRLLFKRAWKSRTRLFARLDDVRRDLESYGSRFTPFQVRKERIGHNHAKLAELREMEDTFDAPTVQIENAEAMRDEAEAAGDSKTVENYNQVIEIFRDQIAKLAFDPEALKLQIKILSAQIAEDMLAQCGLESDVRPALEIKSEYEARLREEKREAEAAKRTYEGLRVIVEEQGKAERADLAKARVALESSFAVREGKLEGRFWMNASAKHDAEQEVLLNQRTIARLTTELAGVREENDLQRKEIAEVSRLMAALVGDPTEHAKSIMAREARITELEQQLRDAGIDPAPGPRLSVEFWTRPFSERFTPDPGSNGAGTPAMGAQRTRIPTVVIEAQGGRQSSLPALPSNPGNAIHTALYRFLDTVQGMPPELRLIECSEREACDWAFFLGQWTLSVSAPWDGTDHPRSTREIPLRRFAETVKRKFPDWLTVRRRARTDPPAAPVAT